MALCELNEALKPLELEIPEPSEWSKEKDETSSYDINQPPSEEAVRFIKHLRDLEQKNKPIYDKVVSGLLNYIKTSLGE